MIVPTYNYARFLRESIESLQAQTFGDWECIVIDDGSTDDTRDIVAALLARDNRIRYFWREHTGVSAARNIGLAASSAPYIQFLDADDLLEPDKLRIHVEYLDRHVSVAIVYGDAATFGTRSVEAAVSALDLGAPIGTGLSAIMPLVVRNGLVIHAPLSRHEAIESAGAFREDLFLLEDWDLWMRCAVGGFAFAREAQEGARALVRVHPHGASRDPDRMMAATLNLRRRFAAIDLAPEAESCNERFLARAEVKLAVSYLRRGSWLRAATKLVRTMPRLRDVFR